MANNGQQTPRQVQGSNTQPQDAALNKPGTGLGDVVKGDPAEEEDYKGIVALKPTDYDQQITLGEAFVTKWVNEPLPRVRLRGADARLFPEAGFCEDVRQRR